MAATRRIVLASLAAMAAATTAARAQAGAPRIRRIALEPEMGGALLVIETEGGGLLDRPVTFALDDPPRLVADLGGVVEAPGRAEGQGAVRAVRWAPRGGGETRIALDLLAPAAFAGEPAVTALAEGGARIALRVQAATVAASAADDRPAAAKARAVRVAIDAGHGGKDPGAIGVGGLREKDVNLAAALTLAEALRARGHTPILTRSEDVFLPLFERVAIARAARADLFVSLHADAHADPNAAGASIYTLAERSESRARAVAQQQDWDLDLAEPPRSAAVKGILLDLAQRETSNRSAGFAQTAIEALAPVTPLLRNTHRNAGFAVLLAPDVPAVLLEMGFLTNPDDERRLADPTARAAMMTALADAVDRFFAEPVMIAEGG